MAKKKEATSASTPQSVGSNTNNSNSPINHNNNVNNNTVNVHVDARPKVTRTRVVKSKKEEKKPNWIVKAVVVAIIGLAVALFGNKIVDALEGGHGKAPVINTPAINPN